MSRIKIIPTVIAIFSLFSLKALSQTQLVTIASVLDNPIDGKSVTLRGKIIDREPGENDYIFTDGTNEIVIEIQDNSFSYDSNTTFEILGTVNLESEHIEERVEDPTPENIEIEVHQIQIIDLDN